MSTLKFDIIGDCKNLMSSLKTAEAGIRSTANTAKAAGSSIDMLFSKLGGALAAIGAGFSAKQLVQEIANVRGEFQQLEIAFSTLIGSEEKANELFSQLVNTAAKTPFGLQDITKGAKQLLAYGVEAENVNDTLVRLGDIAAGLSIPLNDLAYLYGTTMTQGRLFTQDLRQFQGRGIPLADELAKQFGVAKDEVAGLVTAGKVGFPEVEKAIIAMTSEGSKFGGLMEKQSHSITGQIEAIKDSIEIMFNEIGKSQEDNINAVLAVTSKVVENYEKIGKVIGGAITAYGAYKAATIAAIAVKKVEMKVLRQAVAERQLNTEATMAMSNAELIAVGRTQLLNKTTKALIATLKAKSAALMTNPYFWIAAAVAGIYTLITMEKAREVAVKRVNEAMEKEKELAEKQESEARNLISIIKDENKTRESQIRAYNKLKSSIPEYVSSLSLEELQAMKAADQEKRLNDVLEKREYGAFSESLNEANNQLREVEERIDRFKSGLMGVAAWWAKYPMAVAPNPVTAYVHWQDRQLKIDQEFYQMRVDGLREHMREWEEAARQSAEEGEPILVRMAIAEAEQKDAQKAYDEALAKYNEEAANPFTRINWFTQKSLDDATQKLENANAKVASVRKVWENSMKTYGDKYREAEKAVDVARAAYSDALRNKDKYTEEQVKGLKKTLEDAEASFKLLGGDTSGIKSQKQIDEELIRLKIGTANELSNLARTEHEREMARIKSDFDDRMRELEKQEKEWRKSQGGALTAEQTKALEDARNSAIQKNNRETELAIIEYKRRTQEYQELIRLKFLENQRIEEEAVFNTTQTYIDAMEDGADKTLAQMELNHEREKQDLIREKEDLLQAKKEAARELFEANPENEGLLFDASTITLSPEEEQQFAQRNANMDKKHLREREQTEKQVLNDMLGEYRSYESQRQNIQEEYAKKRKKVEEGIARGDGSANEESLQRLNEDEKKALAAIDETFASNSEKFLAWANTIANMSVKQLVNALADAETKLQELESGTASEEELAKARATVKMLQDQIKKVDAEAEVSTRTIDQWKELKEVLDDVSSEFETMGDAIGGTVGVVIGTIGSLSADTVGMINNIFEFSEMCSKGIMKTSDGAVDAIKAVESASVFLAIISAAIQIIRKVVDLAKEAHNATYEENIANHQKRIDKLRESYDKLSEKLDDTFGTSKVQTLKEMNEKLEQQNKLIAEQANEEENIKQKDEDYQNAKKEYEDAMADNTKKMEENKKAMEEAIFGEGIQSAIENFAEAYADAISNNMNLNESAAEQAKKAMKQMVMESIKEYIAGSAKVEQIRNKMQELYADGIFSKQDQKVVTDLYAQLNKELDEKFAWAEDILSDSESSSSSASKRGIATASQESVDENNGRLMSIQMSMDGIMQQMLGFMANISTITSVSVDSNNILSDIRSLHVQSNGWLEDIAKNTKYLNSINTTVTDIVERLKVS